MKHWRGILTRTFEAPTSYLVFAAAFAIATPLAAQDIDPAPVRVACMAFGSPSGSNANNLTVQVDASGPSSTQIVLAGCGPSDFGFLLIGASKTMLPGPFGTVILVRPDIFVSIGQFDARGTARVPIDLLRKDMVGSTVFLQALGVSIERNTMWMSAGCSVRFAAGTVQPKLGYDGPPSTAILIARNDASAEHEVLHCIDAPTTGWKLMETSRQSAGGITRVYMTLVQPRVGGAVRETKRTLIELGLEAQPVIELWIQQTHESNPGPSPYLHAARIARDF